MDLMFAGLLAFLLSGAAALALPGNRLRATANLLLQAVGAACVLMVTVPILAGGANYIGAVEWSYPVARIDLRVDALGAFFLTFSLPLTCLGTLFALGYLAGDLRSRRHAGTHFALLSAVQVSYLIVYTVQNAFAFLLGWELAALSAWLLVIWNHRDQKIRFAGFNYLVSTHLGMLFLVAALTALHGTTGSFDFADHRAALAAPGWQRGIVFVLLMTSFGLKSAFFPFHSWLPRAHSGAPAHVSALMSGVIHKAGLFGMLKFIVLVGTPEAWMGWYLLAVSAVSAFAGVLYTITQRDIKRLLGYSSTENVGIVGMGFGVGCLGLAYKVPALAWLGFGGGLLHVLNHALFKCLLFFGAGAVYRFAHTINLERLGGLAKTMRWTAPLFLLGAVASAALPPLNGFTSELLLYLALLRPGTELGAARLPLTAAAALLALVGGLAALSALRCYGMVFLGVPRAPEHVHPEAREHPAMVVPMACCAVGVVVLGLWPRGAFACVTAPAGLAVAALPAAGTLADALPAGMVAGLTTALWGLLATTAVLAAVRFALLPRCRRRHVTWGCGYTAPNPRMQYTGASFAHPLVEVCGDLLQYQRRATLPEGPFPADGKLETHCVDSVEHGVFTGLERAERVADAALARLPETTRGSILWGAAGLLVLLGMVAVRTWGAK